MHAEKLNHGVKSTFHLRHFVITLIHILLFVIVLFFFFIMRNNFWFILLAITLNQIIYRFSGYIFHHYFNIHAEIELMFISMIIGIYYFGLSTGLILAILGTILVKGQNPIECNFETFIHDIPNRLLIVIAAFFFKGFMSFSLLGLVLSLAYYCVLHSLHELKHHHIPIFEMPTIFANLFVSCLFFQVIVRFFV